MDKNEPAKMNNNNTTRICRNTYPVHRKISLSLCSSSSVRYLAELLFLVNRRLPFGDKLRLLWGQSPHRMKNPQKKEGPQEVWPPRTDWKEGVATCGVALLQD